MKFVGICLTCGEPWCVHMVLFVWTHIGSSRWGRSCEDDKGLKSQEQNRTHSPSANERSGMCRAVPAKMSFYEMT